MKANEHNNLIELAEFWESIADRLDNQPVNMTANTHRLFANELRARLAKMSVEVSWFQRLKNIFGV